MLAEKSGKFAGKARFKLNAVRALAFLYCGGEVTDTRATGKSEQRPKERSSCRKWQQGEFVFSTYDRACMDCTRRGQAQAPSHGTPGAEALVRSSGVAHKIRE